MWSCPTQSPPSLRRAWSAFEPDASLQQPRPDSVDDSAPGWEHAQRGQSASIDHGLSVHEHLELSIAAVNHVHVGLQFATKARRHTDGMKPRESIHAVTDRDSCHAQLLERGVLSVTVEPGPVRTELSAPVPW